MSDQRDEGLPVNPDGGPDQPQQQSGNDPVTSLGPDAAASVAAQNNATDERRMAAAALVQDARNQIVAANRWIIAFFFVLVAAWLPNVAFDLSAGDRGELAERIAEANAAADKTFSSCAFISDEEAKKKDCEKLVRDLETKLRGLNIEIHFVVFRLKSVSVRYQLVLFAVMSVLLLLYMFWARHKVLSSVVAAVETVKYGLQLTPMPADLVLSDVPFWVWPLPDGDGDGERALASRGQGDRQKF